MDRRRDSFLRGLLAGLLGVIVGCSGGSPTTPSSDRGAIDASAREVSVDATAPADVTLEETPAPDLPTDVTPDVNCDEDGDGVRSRACGGIDCDDADRARFPGNPEVCDAMNRDEDCNPCTVAGAIPDGDSDRDGFVARSCANGYEGPAPTCGAATVRVDTAMREVTGTDCDDATTNVRPSQTEACNGRDDNCNDMVDEVDRLYEDQDNDGRGNAAVAMPGMCRPGWVTNNEDCDDTRSETFRGAREQCDGLDNDCSLPGAMAGGREVSEDADGDRHSAVSAMCLGRGEVGALGSNFPKDDCNDMAATVYTGAVEVCGNGIDEDCDRIPDNPSQRVCRDSDGDGHGDRLTLMTVTRCGLNPGEVPEARCDDCDDSITTGARRYPGNREICDRIDNDCMPGLPLPATEEDADSDGHASATATCAGRTSSAPAAFLRDDCDDNNAARFPGNPERCDGIDNDCDNTAADEIGVPANCEANQICRPGAMGNVCRFAVVQLELGGNASCARLSNGSVVCWGDGRMGQLGDGTTIIRYSPEGRPGVGITTATDLAVGTNFACVAAREGRSLQCWGSNEFGQLGSITAGNAFRSEPVTVEVPTGSGSIWDLRFDVTAGHSHACARLLSGGTFRCWGLNDNGQLGDGMITNRSIATAVMSPGYEQLALGRLHTCGRRSDGIVQCWGDNQYGQLGDSTTADRRTRTTNVVGLTGVIDLVAGEEHTCAIVANGAVRCWGRNQYGQLGDGTTTNRSTPVPVRVSGTAPSGAEFRGVDRLALSAFHTCARLTTRLVRCWGRGANGSLGHGGVAASPSDTSANRSNPTAVPDLREVEEVAAAGELTCARTSDGTVLCWGYNNTGQLGDGTGFTRGLPVMVRGL